MNATSGNGFNNFSVNLQNQPRNSVVGTRHIPITKFSRGGNRNRGIGNVDAVNGNKRVTSINFYQNNQAQANKMKNALDISMNSSGKSKVGLNGSLNNSSMILNESMKSSGNTNNVFINKANASSYMST